MHTLNNLYCHFLRKPGEVSVQFEGVLPNLHSCHNLLNFLVRLKGLSNHPSTNDKLQTISC